jgi:hypothetical protein
MKLSDFQTPVINDAPFPVDANLMSRNAKAAALSVNWRKTKITAQGGGAIESDPFKAFGLDSDDRRTRMHDALDRVIDDFEAEPEEDEDAEPEEASDGWLHSVQRQLDAIGRDFGDRAATVIAPQRKVSHSTGYVTDAAFIAQHLDPSMLCVEAENELHDISLRRQADDANRGYWSGLFYFLKSQPKGFRIRDIENQRCLSSLLMHTVGGMNSAFGV